MSREKGAIWKFSLYGFLKNLKFFEPFLFLFFLSRSLDFFQIGLLIGLKEIFVNILEVPTGAFADVYGKKRSMIWTFIAYLVSFLLFYIGYSFALFALAMLFFALGETLRSGTHKSIIFDFLDREGRAGEKVKVYGLTRSYSQLGSALSALIAAGLIFYNGDYGIIFLASMIPYLFDLLLMLTYPEDTPSPKARKFIPLLKEHLVETLRAFRELKGLTVGVVNLSFNSAFFKISKDYLQPILKTWALSLPIFLVFFGERRGAVVIGVVYFFIFIGASLAARNAGRIKDKLGPSTQAMNITYIITFIAFGLIGFFDALNLILPIIVLFLLLYVIHNARKPMMVSYIADIAETSQRATVLSMENQLRSIIAFVGAPILGLLADNLGVAWVFIFCAAVLLASYSIIKLET